ncbi:unnamed protein product, partial [Enterobius vermicularis]|uniref:Conserved plasma membrane protein n=1 Tax=Enterobius vermicularis TaxID=51028 RepID=A0A0N4UX04_ENTVE
FLLGHSIESCSLARIFPVQGFQKFKLRAKSLNFLQSRTQHKHFGQNEESQILRHFKVLNEHLNNDIVFERATAASVTYDKNGMAFKIDLRKSPIKGRIIRASLQIVVRMQVSRGSAKQCLYRRVVGKTVAGIIALLGFVFMIGQGSSEAKASCADTFVKYFEDNTVAWKRVNHQSSSPLHVKLPVHFAPFNPDLINKELKNDLSEVSLLHIYFTNATSVEDYRSKWRPDIQEWVTTVSNVSGVEWLVVFDSTKAREKKNRGAVLEKIKNDFARLVEIDGNVADSVLSLPTTAKDRMLSFLDKVVAEEEKKLSDFKEDYYKLDFNYVGYSNAQMRLIRVYYSLNVIERVLAKLDELDALISLIVGYFVSQTIRPKWISVGEAAASELGPLCRFRKDETASFLTWLNGGTKLLEEINCPSVIVELSDAVFRDSIREDERFANFVHKCFENAVILLEQYGWERQQRLIEYDLALLLLGFNRPKVAVPYLMKVIFLFLRDESSLLAELLSSVVKHLEPSFEVYAKEMVQFYAILSLQGEDEEESVFYCRKLIEVLEKGNIGKPMWSPEMSKRYIPLRATLSSTVPQIIATPGELLKMSLCVFNKFPLSLPNCDVRCIFKKVTSAKSVTNSERGLRYKCSYFASEGVARFGYVLPRRKSSNKLVCEEEQAVYDKKMDRTFIVFKNIESLPCSLPSGQTVLELQAKSANQVFEDFQAQYFGTFALEHVVITIMNSLKFSFTLSDLLEADFNTSLRPICFIYKKMPSVRLKNQTNDLYAGVSQLIEIELFFGSEVDVEKEYFLEVETADHSAVEFWKPSDSKWSRKCKLSAGKGSPGLSATVPVYVCCLLHNLIKYCSEENKSLFFKKLVVTWQGLEWKFDISFKPILQVKKATSLLEDKLLLDLQFLRSDNSCWVVIPEEAVVTACESDLQKPAKLLNPKLTDILPSSLYRIVWVLDDEINQKNDVAELKFNFKYRVRSVNGVYNNVPEAVYNRTHNYDDVFAVPYKKALYELFAQVLSAQPGAVLCRIDSPCDLIVSLRSLSTRSETVIISIDADDEQWSINEKQKFLHVKESGLGQASFSIVPKMIGFLPYPSIAVFRCQHRRSNSDKSALPRCEQNDVGARVPSFVRSAGKQIHVLGLHHSASDQKLAHDKTRRLKDAKNRLAKLFD